MFRAKTVLLELAGIDFATTPRMVLMTLLRDKLIDRRDELTLIKFADMYDDHKLLQASNLVDKLLINAKIDLGILCVDLLQRNDDALELIDITATIIIKTVNAYTTLYPTLRWEEIAQAVGKNMVIDLT